MRITESFITFYSNFARIISVLLYDLATLTLGHPEHLGDVIAGYGTEVDLDLIRAWWSWRCLSNVRWLVEHGYGPPEDYPEVAVLRSRL